MLSNTFVHLPGVGEKTEKRLWAGGVHSWGDALMAPRTPTAWKPLLDESLRQLANRNAGYFAGLLKGNQQWRLYREFRDCCAFVDVETTGLGPYAAITTAALYDGKTLRTYVSGQNLEQLRNDLAGYRLVVTYNGKSFDGPIIRRTLGAELPAAHIDLMHVLRPLGLKGGLKNVERSVGLERPGLHEVDGSTAVLLWDEYRRRGSERALETLLAYNAHDVINLHALVVHAHNEYLKQTPFGPRHGLAAPTLPDVPFRPDADIVARLSQERLALGARW